MIVMSSSTHHDGDRKATALSVAGRLEGLCAVRTNM